MIRGQQSRQSEDSCYCYYDFILFFGRWVRVKERHDTRRHVFVGGKNDIYVYTCKCDVTFPIYMSHVQRMCPVQVPKIVSTTEFNVTHH